MKWPALPIGPLIVMPRLAVWHVVGALDARAVVGVLVLLAGVVVVRRSVAAARRARTEVDRGVVPVPREGEVPAPGRGTLTVDG